MLINMEEKMRKNVTTGMMGLCLILGMIGLLGSSWLVVDVEDVEAKASLGGQYIDSESAEMCENDHGDD